MTSAVPENRRTKENAELHPLSLRYRDSALESLFNREYVDQALPITRLYLFIGLCCYFLFGVLDFLMLGEQAWLIFDLRIVFSLGILACILISFAPWTREHIQHILLIALLIAGAGMVVMLAVLSAPFSYFYYAGIMMVVIYGANLLIIRYFFAAAASTLTILSYAIVATSVNVIPHWILTANLFFLVGTLSWTTWTSYWRETYTRREFASKHLLQIEKLKTDELLEAARAGSRAKTEFLAVMSHELRTPLNAIIGFSEIMRKQLFGPLGSEKYASYVDDIADSGNHLLRVINDILDLSKAEAGKLEIHEDEVDLCDLIQQSLRMFREKGTEAALELVFETPTVRPVAWIDSRLMRQVLINLISNAVKFTPPGGTVSVRLDVATGAPCLITVRDTGIGLKSEDIPRVLEPFVQVESALSRKNGGTGLGLPLVKRIVECHGGEFSLLSKLGEGTAAIVTLPSSRVMSLDTASDAEKELETAPSPSHYAH